MPSLSLIGALVAALLSGFSAWTIQGWRADAARLQAVERTARDMARVVERQDGAATTHEFFKERERVIFQTITETVDRIVERPSYRDDCFDADGLRAIGDAIKGRATPIGQPAPAVP